MNISGGTPHRYLREVTPTEACPANNQLHEQLMNEVRGCGISAKVLHAALGDWGRAGGRVLLNFNIYDLFVFSFVQLILSTVLILSPAHDIGTRFR